MPTRSTYRRSAKKRAAAPALRPSQSPPPAPTGMPTQEELDTLKRAYENMMRVKDESLRGNQSLDEAEAAIRGMYSTEVNIIGVQHPEYFPPDYVEQRTAYDMKELRSRYNRKFPAARKAVAAERVKARQEKAKAKQAEREAGRRAKAEEREAKLRAAAAEREAFKRLKAAEAEALSGKLPLDRLEEAAREAFGLRRASQKHEPLIKSRMGAPFGKLKVELAQLQMLEAGREVFEGTGTLEAAVAACVKYQMCLAELNGKPIDEAHARKLAARDIVKLEKRAAEQVRERERAQSRMHHEAERAEMERRELAAAAADKELSGPARALARLRLAAVEARARDAEQRSKRDAAQMKYDDAAREAERMASEFRIRKGGHLAAATDAALRALEEARRELDEARREFDFYQHVATSVGDVRQRLMRAEDQKLEAERRRKEEQHRKQVQVREARERKLRAERERAERKAREAEERKERKAREAKEREERIARAAKEREEMKLRAERERTEKLRREAELKRRQEKAKAAAESYLRAEVKRLKAEGKGEACDYHLIARPTSAADAPPTAALVKVCIGSGGEVSRAPLGGGHPLTNAVTNLWSLLEVEPSKATRAALEECSRRLSNLVRRPGLNAADSFFETLRVDNSLAPLRAHFEPLWNVLYTAGMGISDDVARRVASELAGELGEMARAFERPALPSSLLD